MFSIGDVFSEESIAIAELDVENSRYVKLLIKDDIITGAIVFGDTNLPLKVKKNSRTEDQASDNEGWH